MELKTFFTRLKYHLKKLVLYPLDIIKFNNEEKFSKIYFLSDNAGWASDRTTKSIFEMTKKNNIKCEQTINHPRNQFVFYGDQYSLFSKNIFNFNNIISFDYEHGLPQYADINKKLLNKVYENQEKISLIRVTNSFFKNILIKKGIDSAKIRQIPLTPNSIFKKFDHKKINLEKKKLNLPSNKFIIGSFHKDGDGFGEGYVPKYIKGPDIFLKCLKSLKAHKDNLFVLLTGPARGYMKKGLKELGIEYKHFNVDHFDELVNFYNCLNIYLISSRDEGGPTGLFEAMACGIPVVTTKVGMAIDFVKNGKNGFLAEVDDYQKLAEGIEVLIEDKVLLDKFSANSVLTTSNHSKKHHQLLWKSFFDDLKMNRIN